MCSGRRCRVADCERMQGDTEPGQVVSVSEIGGRAYQAQQRVGPERQTHKTPHSLAPIDHDRFKLKTAAYNGSLKILDCSKQGLRPRQQLQNQ